MKAFLLTNKIDDPNDYEVYTSDDAYINEELDLEESCIIGEFDTEDELAKLLMEDDYWYRENSRALETTVKMFMDEVRK